MYNRGHSNMRPLRTFTGIFRQRVGLEYLRELLVWLYKQHRSREAACHSFWLWFTGVTERQAQPGGPGDLTPLVADTRHWNWLRFQEELRRDVERVLATLETPTFKSRRPQGRILQSWLDPSGRPVLTWRPVFPKKLTANAVGHFVLDDLFTDLHGVSARSIGQCPQCTHFFVHGRAGNGAYCSARCRYAAAYSRKHGGAKQGARRGRRRVGGKVKR